MHVLYAKFMWICLITGIASVMSLSPVAPRAVLLPVGTRRASSRLHASRSTLPVQPDTQVPVSKSKVTTSVEWSPSSWQTKPIKQAPHYPDENHFDRVITQLGKCSPLVFAGEVRALQEQLARASVGQAFVLMGGDCAESFEEFSVNHVRDTLRVMLQMALVLTFGGSMPVVKIGRMAGQFAKPRSENTEAKDGVTLPSYRGDIINGEDFTAEARVHDPQRMLDAYHQSAQTLNLLRAFSQGGYADITRLHAWNLDFVEHLPAGSKYRHLCSRVDECLAFLRAIGVDTRSPVFTQTAFYTAHESLLLPYEQALTRRDSITGRWYDCSAHLLWVGERTRQADHAHVHFLSGVGNPVGIKVSEKCSAEELIQTLDVLNPLNTPGRVMVIVRMGAENLRHNLPTLIRAVQREGRSVIWVCDPLHANTIKTSTGVKTRPFARILEEVGVFFDVHAKMGSHPGGVHLEMTGQDVTECLGGDVEEVLLQDMGRAYRTSCDPRLNGNQAIELSFMIAERLRASQGILPPLASLS